MSDPSLQIRSAQTIKFGLLAARSSSAIERALARVDLSEEDQEILGKAEEFLRQVADGAAFVTTGVQSGGSALGSTEALGYALKPLESLEFLQGREVPETFDNFARAVHEIAAGNASELDQSLVSGVRAFFERLYDSLRSLIEHNRLRPIANGRSGTLGQYA